MPQEGEPHHDHAPTGDPAAAVRGPVREALGFLPGGVCLLTARFEDERSGLRVLNAMQCAAEPILIAVAARKGHSIEPLIRDSHHFALCVIRPDDKLLLHKFPLGGEPSDGSDPFDAIPVGSMVSRSPVPKRCVAAFDCEVVRHFDLDADHEIYVGQVLAARMSEPG